MLSCKHLGFDSSGLASSSSDIFKSTPFKETREESKDGRDTSDSTVENILEEDNPETFKRCHGESSGDDVGECMDVKELFDNSGREE